MTGGTLSRRTSSPYSTGASSWRAERRARNRKVRASFVLIREWIACATTTVNQLRRSPAASRRNRAEASQASASSKSLVQDFPRREGPRGGTATPQLSPGHPNRNEH